MRRLFPPRRVTSLQAFGLIETCLSLIIMGLILAMSIRGAQTRLHETKSMQTLNLKESLRRHVISFYRTHQKLPCPMSEASRSGLAPDACPSSAAIVHGYLPFKTFGMINETSLVLRQHRYYVSSSATIKKPAPTPILASSGSGMGVVIPTTPPAPPLMLYNSTTNEPLIDRRYQRIAAIIAPADVILTPADGGTAWKLAERHVHKVIIILEQDLIS